MVAESLSEPNVYGPLNPRNKYAQSKVRSGNESPEIIAVTPPVIPTASAAQKAELRPEQTRNIPFVPKPFTSLTLVGMQAL